MLAGLARDGGLYVPDAWPRLEPDAIAGFAGRSYAEVAVEVIRRFTGDSIKDADLARMAREAYGTFVTPRSRRLRNSARARSRSNCSTVRRWRSKTLPCSFWRG